QQEQLVAEFIEKQAEDGGAAGLQPGNVMAQANVVPNPMPPMFPPAGVQDDRFLRMQGRYEEIVQLKIGRRVNVPPPREPSVVREYAHRYQPPRDAVRRDFTDLVYWHPVLVLPGGKADVTFDLSDAATSYQVLVISHTADGRLGSDLFEFGAKLPYSVEPKV